MEIMAVWLLMMAALSMPMLLWLLVLRRQGQTRLVTLARRWLLWAWLAIPLIWAILALMETLFIRPVLGDIGLIRSIALPLWVAVVLSLLVMLWMRILRWRGQMRRADLVSRRLRRLWLVLLLGVVEIIVLVSLLLFWLYPPVQ